MENEHATNKATRMLGRAAYVVVGVIGAIFLADCYNYGIVGWVDFCSFNPLSKVLKGYGEQIKIGGVQMSTSQKVPGLWTMGKGDFEESIVQLEREIMAQGGSPVPLFDLFRTDKEYGRRIAQAMMRKGLLVGSTDLRLAQVILGRNIFTAADWMSYYDAKFTKKQFREAGKFPWGEDILNSICPLCGKVVKDCHFAFWGVDNINGSSLTVAKWLELHKEIFYFKNNPWYIGQPYTDVAVMQRRCYLLHKKIVPGSTGKTPEEQMKMLPLEYEVPTTIAEVTKDILAFRKTGERFNGSKWAACAERTVKTDKANAGLVSCVGLFIAFGLDIYHWDCNPYSYVGLSASRKFSEI